MRTSDQAAVPYINCKTIDEAIAMMVARETIWSFFSSVIAFSCSLERASAAA